MQYNQNTSTMKNILFLFSVLVFFACDPKNKTNPATPVNPGTDTVTTTTTTDDPATTAPAPATILPVFDLILPKGYEKIGEATGDLTKDGVPEKVLVLNTGKPGDMGDEREIRIYKVENNAWKLWHTSTGAVLSSESGGVFGDPFESIDIASGAIVIKHFGGSRQKWAYTHRFRYQNYTWELIGATIINTDPCEELESFDYNLSSGRVEYRLTKESCDDNGNILSSKTLVKEDFNYRMSSLPKMDGFIIGTVYAKHNGKCYPPGNCGH